MPELNIIGAKEKNRYFPYQSAFRVTRKSFYQAGQDSFTAPPAQNPDMFQALTNVEPVLQGNLQRRRGYTLFSNTAPTVPFHEGYAFRSETLNLRRLVWTSSSTVVALDETGAVVSSPLFVPALAAGTVRMVLSRSYGYFADGQRVDYLKWDGTTNPPNALNLTNWGIDIGKNPGSTNGPFVAGNAINNPADTLQLWVPDAGTLATAIATADGVFDRATHTFSGGRTARLNVNTFPFALPPGAVVTGIKVDIKGLQTSSDITNYYLGINLFKAGVLVGTRKYQALPTSNGFISLGGPNDLWGANFFGSDVNNAGFGVEILGFALLAPAATFSLDLVQITVFVSGSNLVLTQAGTGVGPLLSGRIYTVVFQNSATGTTSALYPFSASTGPVAAGVGINITGIPVSSDPQVDTKLILATADGGDETTLYLVAQIFNAVTTYQDSMPDSILLVQPIYQQTDQNGGLHGVANNNPPPISVPFARGIDFPTKHLGRIYGTIGPTLYFSKNLDDVTTSTGTITTKWEEAWPATYSLDVSENAEYITGLLSDGQTLYIGTDASIRRLVGDSPINFQQPQVIFNETGVINQEVWKIVFTEGQPVGSMWLTPDNRVMFSDFNSYLDIGTPIQDVLNSINRTVVQSVSHACFVSKGPAEYFMLYIPTGSSATANTVCVYNLRSKKWVVWQPTDTITASLFNLNILGVPQWLFATQLGPIYQWDDTVRVDRNGNTPVQYSVPMTTSWLDFGDEGLTKAFNAIRVTTADPLLTVAVQGANKDSELDTGGTLVLLPTPLQPDIFGDLFVPMVAQPGLYKWYQLTFNSAASTLVDVLDGFDFDVLPSMRL